jgi:hypothetical protein
MQSSRWQQFLSAFRFDGVIAAAAAAVLEVMSLFHTNREKIKLPAGRVKSECRVEKATRCIKQE